MKKQITLTALALLPLCSPLNAALTYYAPSGATWDTTSGTATDPNADGIWDSTEFGAVADGGTIVTGVTSGTFTANYRNNNGSKRSGAGNIYGANNRISADTVFNVTSTDGLGTIDIRKYDGGKLSFANISSTVTSVTVNVNFDEFLTSPASGPLATAPWGATVVGSTDAVGTIGTIAYNNIHHIVGTQLGTGGKYTPVLALGIHPLTQGNLVGGMIDSSTWAYSSLSTSSGSFVTQTDFQSINGFDLDGDGVITGSVNNNNIVEEAEYNYVKEMEFTFTADDGDPDTTMDTFASGAEFTFSFSGAQNHFTVEDPTFSVPEPSSILLLSLSGLALIGRRKRS